MELGFDQRVGYAEAQRCLNCDAETVFTTPLCIECDACVDICPVDCITFTENGEEADLRERLKAPARNLTQDLYVSTTLPTGRVMVKDEDVCLHCGLCAGAARPARGTCASSFLELTPGAGARPEKPAQGRRRMRAASELSSAAQCGGGGAARRPPDSNTGDAAMRPLRRPPAATTTAVRVRRGDAA